MSKTIIIFFVLLGIIFLALIIVLITEEISAKVRERLRKKRKEYEYKHRFDKPPIAECYCVDCWYRDNEKSSCRRYGLCTADDWFCKEAMPD